MQNTKNKLSNKKCQPCEGSEKPLGEAGISKYLDGLDGWALTNEETLLFREYKMRDFMSAIDFINRIAKIAEEQGHHPDLHLKSYKRAIVKCCGLNQRIPSKFHPLR